MRLPLALLPLVLLSGCAGYALDYAKPKTGLIAPELKRYGLNDEQARCVGDRLAGSLSVWQLRQLTDAAASGVREDGIPLTMQDLVWVASQIRDSRVTLEAARAAGACQISSPAVLPTLAPTVTETTPQGTPPAAPAPVEADTSVPSPAAPGDKMENGPRDYRPTAGLIAALEAYEKGDFAAAARLSTGAAEQGDSGAQQFLGGLYAFGRGVPKDFDVAARYYRLAAEQGWSEAMNNLGKAYETGQGVPRDQVEALKWYLLASLRATEDEEMVQRNMRELIHGMTTEQIESAASLAYDWNQSHRR